jgi:hypothetical protein
MTARRTVLGATLGVSFVTASLALASCASDDESADLDPERTEVAIPASDAGTPDVDGGCMGSDCEFFPDACGSDVLCPSGLFDPVNPSAGPDWRTRITSIRGRSAADAWLVGTAGTAARFDGASWKESGLGTFDAQRFLWLTGAGEVSFGTLARIYSRGLGSGDAGATPDGWALRESVAPPDGYSTVVTATWSTPGSDLLWLGTNADMWRLEINGSMLGSRPGFDSSICTSVPCKFLRSLHGVSAGTVWGVGDNGAAIRITGADGDTPEIGVTNPMTWKGLKGVWAVSDTEAWAVGADGTIIHNTGAQFFWEAVTGVPTREHLNAVAGSSSSDIWAVGNAGVVLHYDGTAWSRVKIAGLGSRRPELYTVWSSGPGGVWIGGQGVLLTLGGRR